jgi:hypothetical protein
MAEATPTTQPEQARHTPESFPDWRSFAAEAYRQTNGKYRVDLDGPSTGTGRPGLANVAHICDEETTTEFVRRWNSYPDLLAACERMVRDQDRPVFSTDFRGAVDALRAAITKAKGGGQ